MSSGPKQERIIQTVSSNKHLGFVVSLTDLRLLDRLADHGFIDLWVHVLGSTWSHLDVRSYCPVLFREPECVSESSSDRVRERTSGLTFSLQAVKWTRTPVVRALGFPKKTSKLNWNFSRSSLSM